MQGVLLASHGKMAKGIAHSITMFFGDNINQFDYECFMPEDNIKEFQKRIIDKVNNLDTGDGVIILLDIFGGTPAQALIPCINGKNLILSGMNFPMTIQALTSRQEHIVSKEELISCGKTAIQSYEPNDEKEPEDSFFG